MQWFLIMIAPYLVLMGSVALVIWLTGRMRFDD